MGTIITLAYLIYRFIMWVAGTIVGTVEGIYLSMKRK
jgi:hypothetical protein